MYKTSSASSINGAGNVVVLIIRMKAEFAKFNT